MLATLPGYRATWLASLLAAVSLRAHGSRSGFGPLGLGSGPRRSLRPPSSCCSAPPAGCYLLLLVPVAALVARPPTRRTGCALWGPPGTTLVGVVLATSSPTGLGGPHGCLGPRGRRRTGLSTPPAIRWGRASGASWCPFGWASPLGTGHRRTMRVGRSACPRWRMTLRCHCGR